MSKRKRRARTQKWTPVKHPGSLEKYGYCLRENAKRRHKALARAYRAYGYRKLVEKVAFLAGAARIPEYLKKRARADLNWLKKTYGG